MDIIKSIDIFAELLLNKEDNIINKGHKLVEKMEGEHSKSQKQVEDNLRLPKITFNQNLQSLIESLALIEGKSDQEESDKACLELN